MSTQRMLLIVFSKLLNKVLEFLVIVFEKTRKSHFNQISYTTLPANTLAQIETPTQTQISSL